MLEFDLSRAGQERAAAEDAEAEAAALGMLVSCWGCANASRSSSRTALRITYGQYAPGDGSLCRRCLRSFRLDLASDLPSEAPGGPLHVTFDERLARLAPTGPGRVLFPDERITPEERDDWLAQLRAAAMRPRRTRDMEED